jgi:DnaJ-class molecular chaperone
VGTRVRTCFAGSYYEIIGVASGAEAGEIKTAYRKLAKELHPDVNPSPEALQKFIEVTTAYVPIVIAYPFSPCVP